VSEGAGVSTIAAGLAASLSETGEGNVLLVDMNLQNGAAHRFHKGDLTGGIDEALTADKREDARVQENLYVVSERDSIEKMPGILPKRFKSLVPRLKASDYDYIIFDMPPVSQISITPRLARFMDMVLLVAESEKSDRDAVKRAGALLAEATVPGLDAHEIVFVNGRFAPELSSFDGIPPGVRLTSLASSIGADPTLVESLWDLTIKFPMKGFTALNTALAGDGAILVVDPDVVVERPVHLLFLSSAPVPFGASVRNLIRVGHHAQVRIVESYTGEPGQEYFTNAITELSGDDESRVEYCRVQRESTSAHHVSGTHLHLGRSAVFASESLSLGGAIVRNDVNAVLDAEGISCTLNGLYLVDGDRLVDNHTTIDHAKPHCESHELYKGILEDRGRGVFNGKIFVREDAQKTDAKQTNKVMLLSDDATIDTKPQLEIFADDVKCTHGAAIGQLDEEALFYLRARGLTLREARDMLIHAYAGEVIEGIAIEALKQQLERELFMQLDRDLADHKA
jgi:Fe-S cluster assembly protein SufD